MLRIANPNGERIPTPTVTCDTFWVIEKIINLCCMPNELIDYFFRDVFAIFLN